MANRTRKKPAPRKAASPARKGGGRLGLVGWVATAGIAGAWAVSDGRVVRDIRAALPSFETGAPLPAAADRVASLIDADRTVRPAPEKRLHPVKAVAREDQPTGSIRPTARPQALPSPRPPQRIGEPAAPVPVPPPSAAALQPFDKPALDMVMRPPPHAARMEAAPDFAATSGVERHATRSLVAHAAPDGASQRIAEIGSGSSVVVLRSAGDWRFVRAPRSGVEGWIDGRYLAGEAAAPSPELATVAQRDLFGRRD